MLGTYCRPSLATDPLSFWLSVSNSTRNLLSWQTPVSGSPSSRTSQKLVFSGLQLLVGEGHRILTPRCALSHAVSDTLMSGPLQSLPLNVLTGSTASLSLRGSLPSYRTVHSTIQWRWSWSSLPSLHSLALSSFLVSIDGTCYIAWHHVLVEGAGSASPVVCSTLLAGEPVFTAWSAAIRSQPAHTVALPIAG